MQLCPYSLNVLTVFGGAKNSLCIAELVINVRISKEKYMHL